MVIRCKRLICNKKKDCYLGRKNLPYTSTSKRKKHYVNGREVALSKYLHLRENLYYNEHHINVIVLIKASTSQN